MREIIEEGNMNYEEGRSDERIFSPITRPFASAELDRLITEMEGLSEEERHAYLQEILAIKNEPAIQKKVNQVTACLLEAPLGTVPIFVIMRFLNAYPATAQKTFVDFLWIIVTFGRTWGVTLKALELSNVKCLKHLNLVKNKAIIPFSVTFITLLRSFADIYAGVIKNNPKYDDSNQEFYSITGGIVAFSAGLLITPPLLSALSKRCNKRPVKQLLDVASKATRYVKNSVSFSGIFYTSIAIFGNMNLGTADLLTIKIALGFSLLVGLIGALYSELSLPNKNLAQYIPDIFRSLAAVAYEFFIFSLLIKHEEEAGPFTFIPYVLAPLLPLFFVFLANWKCNKEADITLLPDTEATIYTNKDTYSISEVPTMWNESSRQSRVKYLVSSSADDQILDKKNGSLLYL